LPTRTNGVRLTSSKTAARPREGPRRQQPDATKTVGATTNVSPASGFSARERKLVAQLRRPLDVQRYLNRLPYNNEPGGRATLRSFRGVVEHGGAHCLEAALFATVVLECHGYPPLVLSFESIDELDHVIFVYRQDGRWGSVARSRDPGLHGRKPVFATPRALALSYFDPYVDLSGRVTGYAVVDVSREMGMYDWRLARTNVWKVERMLLDYPHHRIRSSDARVDRLRARYRAFRAAHPGRKPLSYGGREAWTELPKQDLASW
jgi:hypothetical protein